MQGSFEQAISEHQAAFSLDLSAEHIERLADYYATILEHNGLLHLVAPCSAEEFAIRHILESLTLLEHLSESTIFADIGPGAGLPSIPCLIVRDDLRAILIESKQKKSRFLSAAIERLGLGRRARIIDKQFEEAEPGHATTVTCRALDKFTERLPRLLKWANKRPLLLFGGDNLGTALTGSRAPFVQRLLPLSEKRYLFIVGRDRI